MATLDRYLQTKGRLSPPQAAKVILSVVRKMIDAGDYGVVLPGRISIGKDRSVSLVTEERTLPVAIELPFYASPEIIQGKEDSEASALYSLGCTFFELLSGSPPFNSSDPKKTLRAHLESPPPALTELVPGVPAVLAKTATGLLSKSPAERGSLKALESRLARALGAGQKQGAAGAGKAATPAGSAGIQKKTSTRPDELLDHRFAPNETRETGMNAETACLKIPEAARMDGLTPARYAHRSSQMIRPRSGSWVG